MSDFILDIENMRANARRQIADGAVTHEYRADKEKVIELLQSAVATEWICVLRYTQHQLVAQGIHAEPVARHFGEHAAEEREHAMMLAERMKQLGGTPTLDPAKLVEASHSEYKECANLTEMIKENLVAERIAISAYSEMIRFIGDSDPTTRRILEHVLAQEEEHADDMSDLLSAVNFTHQTH